MSLFEIYCKKILKFVVLLISVFPTLCVAVRIADCANKMDFGGVISNGFMLLGALYLFGMTASALYSGTMATSFVDFLLYPRNYLRTAPVIVSRQKSLIVKGQYALAEAELVELREENPAAPEVALLIAELHARHFNAPDVAVMDIYYYFSRRKLRRHPLNFKIIMRCVELLSQMGREPEAAELLRREISMVLLYSAWERCQLQERVEMISNQSK